MGLMSRLGVGPADEAPPYECKGCETGFDVQYQVCPECGSYAVERVDWD